MSLLCKGKLNCKLAAYTSSKSITFIATSFLVSLSSLQAGPRVSLGVFTATS